MMDMVMNVFAAIGIFCVLGVLYWVLFFSFAEYVRRRREKKKGGEKENAL